MFLKKKNTKSDILRHAYMWVYVCTLTAWVGLNYMKLTTTLISDLKVVPSEDKK